MREIADYVASRRGVCHEERCECAGCGAVTPTTTGRCTRCTYPLDNHSLTRGDDTLVCPVGERDAV